MTTEYNQIPPGPVEKCDFCQDLLTWMSDQFKRFGSIYKASIYGANVYVVSDPQYADHVLRVNWQNYKKGQAIKRVGLLLGDGLMVSEGEFWKSQRRMIQPAFHDEVIGGLSTVIRTANIELAKKWEGAAKEAKSINLTRDISLMVLNVTLVSIFGDDYGQVAPHFSVLSEESERNLQFAQTFRSLGSIVVQVIAQRRKANVTCRDILGTLMDARDRENGEAMPDVQLVREIMTLIVAGHETTASSLNWTWYLLSQSSEAEEKLSRELCNLLGSEFPKLGELPTFAYTRQILEEAMRLYPAGWLMTRRL